ncbi:MAG: DUF4058 family protein [Gemmataceae bacterium]|nr:DUF4058 family protein [Gemmataceae bacterium]
MPIHDWTRVDAGLFHAFHHGWIEELARALNQSVLPDEYFALPEQNIRGPIPDVLTLKLAAEADNSPERAGGIAVAARAPQTRLTRRAEADAYVRKASRITVRHRHGKVVAVVEIISPGNKASQAEFRALVEKSAELIRQGIHLLIIDVFPPGKRDPHGIHKAIWDEFQDEVLELPADKPLTLASYDAGPDYVAYVEFVGVDDDLPDMPLFLMPETYVPVPLQATYRAAWNVFPAPLKRLLDS